METTNIYEKTVIYKIVCKDTNVKDVYVGSTTDLYKRKAQHKSVCNNQKSNLYNSKLYTFIRNNGSFDNWDFIIIENCNFKSSSEAKTRERHYQELLHSTLNKNHAISLKTDEIFTKEYHNNLYKQKYYLYHQKRYLQNKLKKLKEQKNGYCISIQRNNKMIIITLGDSPSFSNSGLTLIKLEVTFVGGIS